MSILGMQKFGDVLNSRSAGREAALRALQIVNGERNLPGELVLDFAGVSIMTPSFADQFISDLEAALPQKAIKFTGIEGNPVLSDVLRAVRKDFVTT